MNEEDIMHIRPIKTHKIDEHLYVVRTIISNFYIYDNGEECICFDTGYMPFIIRAALKKFKLLPEKVSHVFLTHTDYDHVGGINVFSQAKLYLSKDEEEMITYKKPRMLFVFNKRIKREYKLLVNNEVITVGNSSVKAISTPGHTIGSMSYILNDRYIFTGDTLTITSDSIKPFFWLQNMNAQEDRKSTNMIKDINNTCMICTGHSGYMSKNEVNHVKSNQTE